MPLAVPAAPRALPATMHALYVTERGPLLRRDAPLPTPMAGEALVRVHMAGICSTDLHVLRGYKGGFRGILGHEFVGVVVRSPDAPELEQQRVVAEINIGCGDCALCRDGLHKHCRNRRALGLMGWDGVFADYMTAPLENLHVVPNSISDAAAVFTEPLAAALQVAEQVHLAPTMRVYVLGDGRLGQLLAQALSAYYPDTTLVGRNADKLALAARRDIATATLDQLPWLQADPAHVVVEATGSPEGLPIAINLVQPKGTIVLKSTFAELITADMARLAVDEISIVGSRCGPFVPALELLESGQVDPLPLISATYPLADAVVALEHAARKGVLKVLLKTNWEAD